jgi:Tfp pilus assembly protein FimT
MALMALIMAMAFPALARPLDNAKLQADARQMTSLLRMARQQAITSGQPTTVVFYPDHAKYKIKGQSAYYLKSGITFLGRTTFTKQESLLPVCGFSAGGAPTSGGTVTLQNSSKRIYIIVNPVAGRVRISENPPAGW